MVCKTHLLIDFIYKVEFGDKLLDSVNKAADNDRCIGLTMVRAFNDGCTLG